MHKYLISVIALAFSALTAFAEPKATISRLQQRYPWNGLVDITYTLSGCTADRLNEPHFNAVVTVDNADGTTRQIAKEIILTDFVDSEGVTHWNPPESNGTYSVVWDSTVDFPETISPDCTIYISFAPNTPSPLPADATGTANGIIGDLMVIDVSGGSTATNYPVEYYRSVDIGKFNCDVYKTDKIALRRLRAGSFIMGSPEGEYGRGSVSWMMGETQHRVMFTTDSYFGIFAMTQTQYANVMGSNPSAYSGYSDSYKFPVERVSYYTIRGTTDGLDLSKLGSSCVVGSVDATSFLGILRAKTGVGGFDLPTWSQWEYACRAGTKTATYVGDCNDANVNRIAWYISNSESRPHPVGEKEPNSWGIYDMIGNIWELGRDRFSGCGTDWGATDRVDPIMTMNTSWALLLGCGNHYKLPCYRSSCAAGDVYISNEINYLGFRLSVTVPSK